MKKYLNQLPLILFLSFFLFSCGKTIDGNTSDKDYLEASGGTGQNFVLKFKGVPFTGKVKNIGGEDDFRETTRFLYEVYGFPFVYTLGDENYNFKVTPEILSFIEGKLDGEYSVKNILDEEVYVFKYSKGERIKDAADLKKEEEERIRQLSDTLPTVVEEN